MKRLFALAILFCLALAPARADFNDGVYAYSTGKYDEAYNTMRSLAETSAHALAQYYVGMMHYRGEGVEQSYAEAAKWFRKAAEQRVKQAQYRLGELYLNGKGLPKDYEYAYAWYRVGAEHKHGRSISALEKAKSNLSAEELEEAEKLARELIKKFGPAPEEKRQP